MFALGQFSTVVAKLKGKVEQLVRYFKAMSPGAMQLCQRVFREQGNISLVVDVLDLPQNSSLFSTITDVWLR